MRLKVAQIAMQFSDPDDQQKHDADKVFGLGYHWLTGSEAGQQPLRAYLRQAAHDNNYTFATYKSLWVAINKDLISDKKSYNSDAETVYDNDLIVGDGHDPSILWASFTNDKIGDVTVITSHYPRFGRPLGAGPGLSVNLPYTRGLAHAIGTKAEETAVGKAIAFYQGDQNVPDNKYDTFFGEDLTSTWDELGKYEGTGHGVIDVIASYDFDGRVKAVSTTVRDDKELHLFTDHYLLEAVFDVTPLPKKK